MATVITYFFGACSSAHKEIELKLTCSSQDQRKIRAWLAENATYKGTFKQKDHYLDAQDSKADRNIVVNAKTKSVSFSQDHKKYYFKIDDVQVFFSILRSVGCNESVVTHNHVFTPDSNKVKTFLFTRNGWVDAIRALRVRISAKGDFICYKQSTVDTDGKTLSRDEFETQVSDGDTALMLFNYLGFPLKTLIDKVREKYATPGFMITFDTIKDLGTFIDIECDSSFGDDVSRGLNAINNLVKNIGCTTCRVLDRSYIHMLWNPGKDFSYELNLNEKHQE